MAGIEIHAEFSAETQKRLERTNEERQRYLEEKKAKGVKLETPEFRFALKLAEYKAKLENGSMTETDFNATIGKKIQVYIAKLAPEDVLCGLVFLEEYRKLPLSELHARVGTKEEMGTMQRYTN